MQKNILIHRPGFSLLEITVVLIIISILVSAVIPVMSRSYLEKAAQKTALDISVIEDAARKFYIDNNKWPDSNVYATPVAALQAGGYLPSGWAAKNPFVNYAPGLSDFAYHISSNASSLTVYTNVPAEAQPIIENLLPMAFVDLPSSGHNVYSTISVPGDIGILPSGTILAWAGTTVPAGFLLCDGSIYGISAYPNLANVLGAAFGGDGTTTFGVPDLRGRGIVGLNPLINNDSSNRIWSTDSYSDNQGQAASYTVNQIGAVFGEEKHRQTLVEMAPHSHTYNFSSNLASGNNVDVYFSNPSQGVRNYTASTNPTGGNGDGTGLGAAANVVQPSMALSYIIKT